MEAGSETPNIFYPFVSNNIYHVSEPNIPKWAYSLHLETRLYTLIDNNKKLMKTEDMRSRKSEEDQE